MEPFSVFEEEFELIKPSGDRLRCCGIWGDRFVTVHASTFAAKAGDVVERSAGTDVERRDVVGVRFERGMVGMPDAYHLELRHPNPRATQVVNHNTTYNIHAPVGAVGPNATANANTIIGATRPEPRNTSHSIWTTAFEQQRANWKCKAQGIGVFSLAFRPDLVGAQLDHDQLRQLVQRSHTEWGGWSLPTFLPGNIPRIQNRAGLIEGTYSRSTEQEIWQLHESGEFMLARKLRYESDKGQKFIPYEDVVHGIAMGLVFARRLYAGLGTNQVGFRFALLGVRNHVLGTVKNRHVGADPSQTAGEDEVPAVGSVDLVELQDTWPSVVVDVTNQILRMFNAVKARAAIDALLENFVPRHRR